MPLFLQPSADQQGKNDARCDKIGQWPFAPADGTVAWFTRVLAKKHWERIAFGIARGENKALAAMHVDNHLALRKSGKSFMSKPLTVPIHRPFTLDEYIAYTGWEVPGVIYKRNMGLALDYFQKNVPLPVLKQRVERGPWTLPVGGEVIRLTSWMQAIDYGKPVDPNCLVPANYVLIAFRVDSDIRKEQARGNWYTYQTTQQNTVAIVHDQERKRLYKVVAPIKCLKTTVADAYVDWARQRGVNPEYRAGGGIQLFLWQADRFLKPM
jgi:hypothetical protein